MITKKERDSAKWVHTFEKLDDNELILAHKICEKILKLRNCYCRVMSKEVDYEYQNTKETPSFR